MSRPPEPASFEPAPRAATREAERRIDQGAGRAELARRLRQQAVVSDFGRLALEERDFGVLLQRACEMCADGLGVRFAKVLQWLPDTECFLIRAGVGWRPGVVGQTMEGDDLESPAGFAFHSGAPVISNHLIDDTRFKASRVMREHGVKRALNVLIRVGEKLPYGVLEADSPDEGAFEQADLAFLQGFANLLGVAVERGRAEAALAEARERLHAALDAAEMGALDFDPQTGELHLDARCMLLLGLPADAPMDYARLMECVGPEARQAIEAAVVRALDPTGPGDFFIEIAVMSPQDGEKHWIAARGRVLDVRKSRRVVGIAFDVTYRRRAEELMREALEHQAMLVREVSHRVKNSLQLVAGVLALQARAAQHEEVRQALTVAQTRLQTIGQVHDQLWRQPDMQEVELAGFLRSLCDKLQESAAGHMVNFAGQPVTISADRAIPVALLVNELVTNALKYAYPEGGGPVDVELTVDGERLTLVVCDHGVGLPAAPEGDGRESLGMRIVRGLVRQLRAEMETGSNDPGARFVLRFERTEPEAETAL